MNRGCAAGAARGPAPERASSTRGGCAHCSHTYESTRIQGRGLPRPRGTAAALRERGYGRGAS